MKKLGRLFIVTLMLMVLPACSAADCALPKLWDALYLRRYPIAAFSHEESARMMNVMNANRVFVTEDALYTLELDKLSRPVLAAYTLDSGRLLDYSILRENCAAKWLTELDGVLYYINGENGDALECLEPESLEHRVLAEGPCSYLQLKDGMLYYRNAELFFCSMTPDGENVKLVLDEPCCYPFFVGEALIFQSESEGEILKLRFGQGEDAKEIALTESAAYAPVVIMDRLFYTCDGWIKSMGLNGMDPAQCSGDVVSGAAEYLYEGDRWYARAVSTGYGVQQWRCALPEGQAEDYPYTGYAYCDFMGNGFRVDADYFADGRLRAFIFYTPQGGKAEYLYGKITNYG